MRKGFRFNMDGLHVVYQLNTLQHARLGLAVSRKFGNAVKRNRLKRVLREVFRQHDVRDTGVDVLLIPAKTSKFVVNYSDASCRALDKMMVRLRKTS